MSSEQPPVIGAQAMLGVNNACVVLCAGILWLCLTFLANGGVLYVAFLCMALLFSTVSNAAIRGKKIIYTKDWVMVLVSYDKDAVLSGLCAAAFQFTVASGQNATLTLIDQLSAIVAPIAAGFLVSHAGLPLSSLVFVAASITFWGIQAVLLRLIGRRVPSIRQRTFCGKDTKR